MGVKKSISGSETRSKAGKKTSSGPVRSGQARAQHRARGSARLRAPGSVPARGERTQIRWKTAKIRPEGPPGLPAALTETLRINTQINSGGERGPRPGASPQGTPNLQGVFLSRSGGRKGRNSPAFGGVSLSTSLPGLCHRPRWTNMLSPLRTPRTFRTGGGDGKITRRLQGGKMGEKN